MAKITYRGREVTFRLLPETYLELEERGVPFSDFSDPDRNIRAVISLFALIVAPGLPLTEAIKDLPPIGKLMKALEEARKEYANSK
jgi:hypothetical protein